MDVSSELTRDGRVFIYRLSGLLDFARIKELTSKWEAEILTPARLPVYYISDFTGITGLPAKTLSNALDLARKPSPKLRLNVIVTRNQFVATMAGVLSRVVKTFNIRVVPTMEEAWAIVDRALAEEAAQNASKPS